MNEKRKYVRVDFGGTVQYRELDHPSLPIGTKIVDLSEGGIRFQTDRFIPVTTKLILEMNVPRVARPLKVFAKPAWSRSLTSVESYEVGAQFLDMSDEDREVIRQLIDSGMKSHSSTH